MTTDGVPSISSCTWPETRCFSRVEQAFDDFLNTLGALNYELNGAVPSQGESHDDALPRALVYAVTEVIRMLREGQIERESECDHQQISHVAWRAEAAWSATLAGDIDDLRAFLEHEELARS